MHAVDRRSRPTAIELAGGSQLGFLEITEREGSEMAMDTLKASYIDGLKTVFHMSREWT